MTKALFDCDRCGAKIYEGTECYSLTLSRDYIETDGFSVQPLEANSVAIWCIDCGPNAVKEITQQKT